MPAKGTENPLTLIDVARGGITNSDIVILNKHNATYAIRLQKGAVLERNRIVVPSANSILVENGAMAQQNIVQHFDRVAEGSAFTGTGTIQHNLEHQPL
jgi:predicted transcriptional regulator